MPRFKTKSEERIYFQEILKRYEPGQRLSPQDYRDVLELLQKHSECKQKTGCGIADFSVMIATAGTKCFQIIRADGSREHFSYLHCICNKPRAKKTQVRNAMREAVYKDIQEFKNKSFAGVELIKCAVSGEMIKRSQAHVDHAIPVTFEYIADNFMDDFNLTYEGIEIDSTTHFIETLKDKNLEQTFRQYHNKMAVLRIVKDKVNLSDLRKKKQ